MTLNEIREQAITPALALLPARMSSPEAEVMLLAIGLQESRFQHRRQLVGSPPRPTGPAKSFWQAELGGGMVTGLLRYHDDSVRDLAVGLCAVRGVDPSPRAVWDVIERDDVLAAGLARLLLWTDRPPLPALQDVEGGWQLYLRTWRPGKPHRSSWDALYAQALEEVCGWAR